MHNTFVLLLYKKTEYDKATDVNSNEAPLNYSMRRV